MNNERDFKGVWIPKEVWLNDNLSMIEKGILTEISSLDNENHCTASNEYFAKFCQCSVATVTRAIKHLTELHYIEQISFDGRHRVIKMSSQPNQNDEADSSFCNTNNTVNNTMNKNKVLSKDNTRGDGFNFGVEKPKKSNNVSEYNDAIMLVNSYTTDKTLRKELIKLVNMKKDICSKERHRFYCSTIKNYLDGLDEQFEDDTKTKIEAVKLSNRYNGTTKIMRPNVTNYSNSSIKDVEGFVSPDITTDGLDHTTSKMEF